MNVQSQLSSPHEAPALPNSTGNGTLRVSFPPQRGEHQDQERFDLEKDGVRHTFRCHDYGRIYGVPGLYEAVFGEHLKCCSPQAVCGLLAEQLAEERVDASTMRVLDLGAGNGMVGEQLRAAGARNIVGVDLLPEAAAAAARDRPGVYDDYLACDLTNLRDAERSRLAARRFNTLVTVAALGFDDLPPQAFTAAFNLIEAGGWIAFNLKEDFLADDDESGFAALIERMLDAGMLEPRARHRYRHRLSVTGAPLYYVAFIGVKHADIPMAWLEDAPAREQVGSA